MSTSEDLVKVLYSYSYNDETGPVQIEEGEEYRLLERTNTEWWHVCPVSDSKFENAEEHGFFVPAKYVCVVKKDREVDNAISSLDDVLSQEEQTFVSPLSEDHGGTISEPEPDYSDLHKGSRPNTEPAYKHHGLKNGMGNSSESKEVLYMNLDNFRAGANISQLDNHKLPSIKETESDYANIPCQYRPAQEQLPRLEDGVYLRQLVSHLPWDIYEELSSKRHFYHNHDTDELSWKPPRKDKPLSPVDRGPDFLEMKEGFTVDKPNMPSGVSITIDDRTEDVFTPFEYDKVDEQGEMFFVHKTTHERWQRLVDNGGRQYFHRLGSSDTRWELPALSRSKSESHMRSASNVELTLDANATDTSTAASARHSKSKSMYGSLDVSLENSGQKSCTLPPNFAPGPNFQQTSSLRKVEDPLSGILNKAKLTDAGKKRVKKSWTQSYVVLQASNLVFYKDQKAAIQKPGFQHGKPELVINLNGAKVDFNPSREITSRRNCVLLSVNSGMQFLLHHDDEKIIHNWLVKLKLIADDLKEDSSYRETNGSSGIGSFTRQSSEDSNSSMDRNKNMQGIRTKLLSLITRRPTQDDLVKRGIIKDSIFGSTIQHLCEREKGVVPNFILRCITAVEAKGLEHDGLYRISGNLAEIQRLRYAVDKEDTYDLLDPQWDVHTLTGAFKLFFRELREPLFTVKYVTKFMDAVKRDIKKDKLRGFKEALSLLPKYHFETIRAVFQHLTNVSKFSKENRMQVQNLAIVFGPTLMWADGDFTNMAILTIYQSKVVEFILLEYDNLFK